MLKRQSSESPGTFAFARSRSTIARRPAISSALVLCSTSQLFLNQSPKLTVVADQKNLLRAHHAAQEVILRLQLAGEIARGVHGGIDLAPDRLLCRTERFRYFAERHSADHHEIDVTPPPLR